MHHEELRRVYTRVIEALADGNVDELDSLLAPEVIDHNALRGQASGIEGFKQWLARARSAFPDLSAQVEATVAEGELVAGRVTYRGTHGGDFMGIPATHQAVEFEAFHVVRGRHGRIVEWWGTADLLGALTRLGATLVAPG